MNDVLSIINSISTALPDSTTVAAAFGGKKLYDDFASPTIKEAGVLGAKIFKALTFSADLWSQKRIDKLTTLQDEVAENLKDFPEERIVDVAPDYIVGPAINAYMYSMSNQELKSMYSKLISKSLLKENTTIIHPAMTYIIQNLMPTEALLLKYLYLKKKASIPLMKTAWRAKEDAQGYITSLKDIYIQPHQSEIKEDNSEIEFSDFKKGSPATISNLVRLGILEISYIEFLTDNKNYEPIEQLPEYVSDKEYCERKNLVFVAEKGVAKITALGSDFMKVCIE